MLHPKIRLIAPIAALAVLGTAPVAGANTVHHYSSHVVSGPLSTGGGYPQPGGTALLAGSLTSKPFGAGALIDRVTITGNPQPTVFAFKGTEVDYLADGTLRNVFTGSATVLGDGSQRIIVNGHITGGTGRYRGASGKYTFNGTTAAGSTLLVGGSTGTVVLPGASTRAAARFTPARGVRFAPGITVEGGHFAYYDVADPSRMYRPAAGVQLAKGWVIRNGRLERVVS